MKKYINITILIIWMIIIFILSNDNGISSSYKSDEVTSFILDKFSIFTGNRLNIEIDNIVFLVRKCAHFIEYFILGLLVVNVIKDYKKINYSLLILSVFICFMYAFSDEIHQLLVAGRSGKFIDVLIDTIGSTCGIIFYFAIYSGKKLIKNK